MYCVRFESFKATKTDLLTVRDKPVRIVRVVVVQSAGGVHVADVVRVARIRAAKPPVPRLL